MKHIMIDLETLATSANSVVVSVGACVFTDIEIERSGYWVLDMNEQYKKGRAMSVDTIRWWLNQSEEARQVFTLKPFTLFSLDEFAKQFNEFFCGEQLHMWGNGADFDCAIMIDLFERHQLPKPEGWKYYNHMCYRTFHQLFKCKNLAPRQGTHHHALDDAIHQAKCVIASGRLKEFSHL